MRYRVGVPLAANGYFGGVLRGMRSFVLSGTPWIVDLWPNEDFGLMSLERERPDGLLIAEHKKEWGPLIERLDIPVVNIASLRRSDLPYVGLDDVAVGRLAAQYFLDRGFRELGYCGLPEAQFSRDRAEGFAAEVEAADLTPKMFGIHRDVMSTLDAVELIGRWISTLRQPAAVFVSHDGLGLLVSQVCADLGVRVPEDVALLGVDNDDLLCGLAKPAMSSIDTPSERVGYEAAALLHRMMSGEEPQRRGMRILLPPGEVVTRQSSDLVAVPDTEVAQAVRYIRDHYAEPITVKHVLDAVPMSRRLLERRFKAALGRTPHEEIERVRAERAKALLGQTTLPMPEIARQCGYAYATHFATSFKRQTGQSPTAYRRSVRPG